MNRSAVLINIARGSIVDDTALAQALKARQIWAAGLDVYENEPKVNPALFELDNVVLSPHIASASEPTRQAMAMTGGEELRGGADHGDSPPNLLNPRFDEDLTTQDNTGHRGHDDREKRQAGT